MRYFTGCGNGDIFEKATLKDDEIPGAPFVPFTPACKTTCNSGTCSKLTVHNAHETEDRIAT